MLILVTNLYVVVSGKGGKFQRLFAVLTLSTPSVRKTTRCLESRARLSERVVLTGRLAD